MLVLSRYVNESIVITSPDGVRIRISPVGIRDSKIRLGIEAPKEWSVHRSEIQAEIDREGGERREVTMAGTTTLEDTVESVHRGLAIHATPDDWNATVRALVAEIDRLGARVAELDRETERLKDDVLDKDDAIQCLRRLGDISGCDHVACEGDRARLVRCIEEAFEVASARVAELGRERDAWQDRASIEAAMRQDITRMVRAARGKEGGHG